MHEPNIQTAICLEVNEPLDIHASRLDEPRPACLSSARAGELAKLRDEKVAGVSRARIKRDQLPGDLVLAEKLVNDGGLKAAQHLANSACGPELALDARYV